jgi:D-glycero-D-manno-heptose 1,7-bisphosphate phosphatase
VGARVEAIFFCPHAPEDGCHCRKPEPGLFEQIGQRFGLPLADVPVAGNALRHVRAGAAAGCPTHLLLTGHSEHLRAVDDASIDVPPHTRVHEDLSAFVDWLLAQEAAAVASATVAP